MDNAACVRVSDRVADVNEVPEQLTERLRSRIRQASLGAHGVELFDLALEIAVALNVAHYEIRPPLDVEAHKMNRQERRVFQPRGHLSLDQQARLEFRKVRVSLLDPL